MAKYQRLGDMPLTELEVKKIRASDKPKKLSDGGGLFLLVQPNGSKYWRLAYRFDGKQRTLALGVYPDVGLAMARSRREEARKLLTAGSDPGMLRKEAKRSAQAETVNCFEALAREYHKIKAPSWTDGHAKQWIRNMEVYAFPIIGTIRIDVIEPLQIIGILRGMERAKTYETRDRLGQSIGAVFKYAIAIGIAKFNPAAEIRMALAERPSVEHFACIDVFEIPSFLRALTAYEDRGKVSIIAISSLRLMLLTATRTSEVRYAKWRDFDFVSGLWTIPASQIGRKGKGNQRRDHAVPLSTQAVAILQDLYPITGEGEFVFPNRNTYGRVISENTALKIIDSIGYGGRMTGHGFRSLARTVLGDMGYRWEVLEAMLSHAIANQTAAAYVRTSYFEERKAIMQKWADYLDQAEIGSVHQSA